MSLKIYIGDEKCTTCGKKHKKVFEIDGKPYGSSCAQVILGKELTAPIWLYKLAEGWVLEETEEKSGYTLENVSDCATNFFGTYCLADGILDSTGSSKLWLKSVKIGDKSVKLDWQFEIHDYIVARYTELNDLK